ncbi:hypothetical protein FHW69_002526 [Luteibacter sp. Sphag1AF]|uniref:hypothetical protein n=1 Tax=Luteibacter sp. Sphag1AF TaxID=2587031 RepID=UPI00161B37B5|nr:hypothetical protein [Luteibacter sp. Sphag1AF]MBB3227894.1 hypothetical protein [Luteibacter sp. Sphag1AF]
MARHGAKRHRIYAWLLTACLASPAFAGTPEYVPVDDAESGVVEEMIDTFSRFAFSIDAWLRLEAPGSPTLIVGGVYDNFASRFLSATFGRFEYKYEVNGRKFVRTYYSTSGEEPDEAFGRLVEAATGYRPPLSPASESFRTSSSSVRVVLIDEDQSPIKAGDALDGVVHARDAELKMLRQLHAEIASGVVEDGGVLAGRITQAPCYSCRGAFEQFLELHPRIAEPQIEYLLRDSPAYARYKDVRNIVWRTTRRHRAAQSSWYLEDVLDSPPRSPPPAPDPDC